QGESQGGGSERTAARGGRTGSGEAEGRRPEEERGGEGEEAMSDASVPPPNGGAPHWTARFGKSIIFVILTLVGVGAYLAITIPVAVFPETDFPRIVVGVDNGVMPIDQMLVTITRPLEEAVNSVQGLDHLWSITSRGTAEIDLFFDWSV